MGQSRTSAQKTRIHVDLNSDKPLYSILLCINMDVRMHTHHRYILIYFPNYCQSDPWYLRYGMHITAYYNDCSEMSMAIKTTASQFMEDMERKSNCQSSPFASLLLLTNEYAHFLYNYMTLHSQIVSTLNIGLTACMSLSISGADIQMEWMHWLISQRKRVRALEEKVHEARCVSSPRLIPIYSIFAQPRTTCFCIIHVTVIMTYYAIINNSNLINWHAKLSTMWRSEPLNDECQIVMARVQLIGMSFSKSRKSRTIHSRDAWSLSLMKSTLPYPRFPSLSLF